MSQSHKLQVKVYNSESEIKNFFGLFKLIFTGFKDGRNLGWALFIRDLKASYRQSILGLFWAFLPPLATAGVWIYLNSTSVVSVEKTSIPYPLFVFIGVMLFQIFKEAVTSPLTTVGKSKGLLVKLNFPREALLIQCFCENLFNTLIKLIIIITAFLFFKVSITAMVIPGVLSFLVLILLGMSIGLILLPIGLLYSDIQRGMGMFMQFFIYLTPALFPIPKSGWSKWLVTYNPLTPAIMNTRDWLTTGETYDLPTYFWVIGISVAISLIGLIIYKVALSHLIERMGS